MPESTLSVSRQDILRLIGQYLGWNQSYALWSAGQMQRAEDIVASGLRQFYTPPILPGERTIHKWSFLSPWATLGLQADKGDYDLPDDFGGLDDELTFISDTVGSCPIQLVSEAEIRRRRQVEGNDVTGYPTMACIVPVASDGDDPQRWMISFRPIPGGDYELQFRYRSNPFQLSPSKPYPLGGQPHAETLISSCLAAAELKMNDEQGPYYADFVEKLRSSVALDRSINLQTLGYNGDGPTISEYERGTTVLFNGVIV